jgi:plastocyanin
VSFTKPGTYKFFCDVHPGMVGYIVVKPKGTKTPSAKQDAAALLGQETADIKAAKKLLKIKQPADTVSLGESTPGGVELYTMFPNTLSVKAGTVVTFRMSAHSRETHTAAFGPVPYLTPIAKSFGSANFSPLGTYPSDPSSPLTLGSNTHGNGFVNTGTLDNDPSTKQIRPSSKIDFTTPGTYHYVCLIHPFMHGTIIVH